MSMQREAQLIKDCLTFSGPPDPLRGEEIYSRYLMNAMARVKHLCSSKTCRNKGLRDGRRRDDLELFVVLWYDTRTRCSAASVRSRWPAFF